MTIEKLQALKIAALKNGDVNTKRVLSDMIDSCQKATITPKGRVELIEKVPEDGLTGLSDEENLGFSYKTLDNFLLYRITPPYEVYKNIEQRHKRNLHKTEEMPICPFF